MTVIINKQEELEALIDKHNNITIKDDLIINCSIDIDANIKAWYHIKARDINANDIKARDIKARDINANDIDAFDIKANDINANDIDAFDIKARDINANDIDAFDIKPRDIKANDIKADYIKANNIKVRNINYYSFCVARESLKCKTIEGKRKNALHACLDKPIEYIK